MGRLIDVDALRADYGMADDCKDCKTGYRSCEYDRIYSKMDFCGWLDDAPTVDAVPVRHGRWIIRTRHEHYPSGRVYEDIVCPFCGKVDHNGDGNFCGYCGADMREDGDYGKAD